MAKKVEEVKQEVKKKTGVPAAKILCVKCDTLKGISKDRMLKLVEKKGSEEKVRKDYLCRGCRPKTVKTVKEE